MKHKDKIINIQDYMLTSAFARTVVSWYIGDDPGVST